MASFPSKGGIIIFQILIIKERKDRYFLFSPKFFFNVKVEELNYKKIFFGKEFIFNCILFTLQK